MAVSEETTARDVAKWMLTELHEHDFLDQESTVYKIRKQFGSDFLYVNANGNHAIDKAVLKAFRDMTGDVVVGSVLNVAGATGKNTPGRQWERDIAVRRAKGTIAAARAS